MKYLCLFVFLTLPCISKGQVYATFEKYQLIMDDSTHLSYLYDTISQKKSPIRYPYAKSRRHQFRHRFVYVRTGDMKGLMDLNGKRILDPCHFIHFQNKDSLISAYICQSGSWMILNYDGDTLSYGFRGGNNYVPRLNDELTLVKTTIKEGKIDRNGIFKYGYLGRNGRWHIFPIFEEALPFEQGIAKVKLNGKWKWIDKNGDFVPLPSTEKEE